MVEALDDRREVLRDGMELDILNGVTEQLCCRICDEGERTADQARRHRAWDRRNHRRANRIGNDQELRVTLDRIAKFQGQVAELRVSETNPANYHASVSGFIAIGLSPVP